MHFSMSETICGALQEDERIETYATCCWAGGLKVPLETVFHLLGEARLKFVPYEKAKWRKWDLYVSSCFDNPWLARTVPWVDTFHGVGEKFIPNEDRLYMVHPLAKRYDRLLCPNQRLADGYKKRAEFLKSPDSLCLTGMPRADMLVWLNDLEVRNALRSALGVRQDERLLLFAPTYGADGVLHAFGTQIIEACLRARIHVVVKLHSCSYLPDPKYSCGVKWTHELQQYGRSKAFLHLPQANLTALMIAADAIVTDFGSAAVESSLLDTPLFFFGIKSQAERTGGDRVQFDLLCSAGGCLKDMKGFHERLTAFLRGDELNRNERSDLRETFFYSSGRATENSLRIMYSLMNLRYPDGLLKSYIAKKRQQVLTNPRAFLGLETKLAQSPRPGKPPLPPHRGHFGDFSIAPQRLNELAAELSAYNGRPIEDVCVRLEYEVRSLGGSIAEEWKKRHPVTARQIERFYQETDAYLYELLIDGENPFRNKMRAALVEALRSANAKRVFEFGGGIGTDALWFAQRGFQWTYYDLPDGQTCKFAKWRFTRNSLPVAVVTNSGQSTGNDAVISLEVFEHLPNLFAALRTINRTLRPDGLLLFTESFGKTERHPLHLTRAAILGRFLSELVYAAGFDSYRLFGPEDCLYRTVKRRDPAWYDYIQIVILVCSRVLRKMPVKFSKILFGRDPKIEAPHS